MSHAPLQVLDELLESYNYTIYSFGTTCYCGAPGLNVFNFFIFTHNHTFVCPFQHISYLSQTYSYNIHSICHNLSHGHNKFIFFISCDFCRSFFQNSISYLVYSKTMSVGSTFRTFCRPVSRLPIFVIFFVI